ncbi:hypothetical protein CYLTODRAFT_410012 [Cylindrobasidium torrendii FP15055 ss-10]|uniref:Uncharacterized protein n=1 Tax=Cylindrobasidium torrendii FP15055 ss-10 TaxID=1314674 RepID=A0A0D7BEJ0_9AGAR|nr:hypothetical protein CYLTODRAFT_410012 [Cylindrobasidium torrendii FP15055 ss-10]
MRSDRPPEYSTSNTRVSFAASIVLRPLPVASQSAVDSAIIERTRMDCYLLGKGTLGWIATSLGKAHCKLGRWASPPLSYPTRRWWILGGGLLDAQSLNGGTHVARVLDQGLGSGQGRGERGGASLRVDMSMGGLRDARLGSAFALPFSAGAAAPSPRLPPGPWTQDMGSCSRPWTVTVCFDARTIRQRRFVCCSNQEVGDADEFAGDLVNNITAEYCMSRALGWASVMGNAQGEQVYGSASIRRDEWAWKGKRGGVCDPINGLVQVVHLCLASSTSVLAVTSETNLLKREEKDV